MRFGLIASVPGSECFPTEAYPAPARPFYILRARRERGARRRRHLFSTIRSAAFRGMCLSFAKTSRACRRAERRLNGGCRDYSPDALHAAQENHAAVNRLSGLKAHSRVNGRNGDEILPIKRSDIGRRMGEAARGPQLIAVAIPNLIAERENAAQLKTSGRPCK